MAETTFQEVTKGLTTPGAEQVMKVGQLARPEEERLGKELTAAEGKVEQEKQQIAEIESKFQTQALETEAQAKKSAREKYAQQ